MGPVRLTGMNGVVHRLDEALGRVASMEPGRLTGMNVDLALAEEQRGERVASMGPGRLTGMNAGTSQRRGVNGWVLQWGPVD